MTMLWKPHGNPPNGGKNRPPRIEELVRHFWRWKDLSGDWGDVLENLDIWAIFRLIDPGLMLWLRFSGTYIEIYARSPTEWRMREIYGTWLRTFSGPPFRGWSPMISPFESDVYQLGKHHFSPFLLVKSFFELINHLKSQCFWVNPPFVGTLW